MKDTLSNKLYEREIARRPSHSRSYRSLYSDRRLIDNLDIVNELAGHTGCVNALSWSKSGALLASGSDDQHLNIHRYQPEDSVAQFRLATTVATGHTANIFSVKFMPHSNDRTVVTCAGDSEVRVFDLEYSGETQEASRASLMAYEGRRSRRGAIYNGVRYLNDGDSNARVYRSHGDRAKRIVTESSPHLFLSCSEDGEVRQWDLRQPSSAYPSPRSSRFGGGSDASVPPPLISYKRYQLDLNTISCSASQPHYIALGGAHLYAFLHDRRMIGRDRLHEAGKPLQPSRSMSSEDEELMNQATKCVRKFAPKEPAKKMESGHITACKISDARPNEMIVSWSGDHIYSFDLTGADGEESSQSRERRKAKRNKDSADRKRKRQPNGSQTSLARNARPSSRPRTGEGGSDEPAAALRIRYANGQSEDIPLASEKAAARDISKDREFQARRFAEVAETIRSSIFETNGDVDSSTLEQAWTILQDMTDAMESWRYPMKPSPDVVIRQQKRRKDRESSRRFVQAAGTLARVLGAVLPSGSSHGLSFASIDTRGNDIQPRREEQFGYDFLKAILLWLDSGIGRLIEGFTRPADMLPTSKAASRLPIPASEASTESVDEYLIPYLLRLASDQPVEDVEKRFEVAENRQLFATEKAAVQAFAAAVKIPFEDLSLAVIWAEGSDVIQAQDRRTALKYWASKVGRGVLLNAAKGVDYQLVHRAFRGVESFMPTLADGVPATPAEPAGLVERSDDGEDDADDDDDDEVLERAGEKAPGTRIEGVDVIEDHENDKNEDDDEDMRDDPESEADADSSEPDEEDGVPNTGMPRFMYASAYERRRMRNQVGQDVPSSTSTKRYRGHCNVRTVKDVNYFGLDDEYVVSGSDDGHFFIWDRKTSELVNVLEGDGETVNVIQGHPYETMLAVSGIDHTIKIFSPDGRARQVARMGQEVQAADPAAFSSLAWPARAGRRRPRGESTATSEPAVPADTGVSEDPDEVEHVAPTGLRSRRRMHDAYRIMNQNDVDRQGGNQDAFLTVRDLHPLLLLMNRGMW